PPECRTIPLHDALPISATRAKQAMRTATRMTGRTRLRAPMPTSRRTRIRTRTSKRRAHTAQASADDPARTVPRSAQLVERLAARSEEHTSELQSRENLV